MRAIQAYSLLAALLFAPLSAFAAERFGTLTELKPKAALAPESPSKTLSLGGPLLAGDRLKTGAAGRLAFVTQDGSLVRLGTNSELNLSVPAQGAGSLFHLVKGLFQAVVEKQGTRQFQVDSNGGVAAVKGTQLQFEATDKGSELKVLEGSVALSDPAGKSSVTVGAGEAALSYPDRVDQVRKMTAAEVKSLRGAFKALVDMKKKEYARRVREARGQRSEAKEAK